MRPNFTLNLGARYTFFQLFNEANGKANPFDFDTCGPQGFCGIGASFGQQNYGDFDPRLGLDLVASAGLQRRWFAPASECTTKMASSTIRICPRRTRFHPTRSRARGVVQVTYPPDAYFTSSTISPNAEQRDRKDSYTEQWDLSVQRELPANFVGTVSYVGSHGVHLLETNVVNLIELRPPD